jgi:hypothetical protein
MRIGTSALGRPTKQRQQHVGTSLVAKDIAKPYSTTCTVPTKFFRFIECIALSAFAGSRAAKDPTQSVSLREPGSACLLVRLSKFQLRSLGVASSAGTDFVLLKDHNQRVGSRPLL